MSINLKKILSIGLAAALATTMSVGFADNDDDDDDQGSRNEYKYRVLNALEPSVDTKETIVVSLAISPVDVKSLDIVGNPEPACVALQIARNLLMDDLNGPADGGKVTPADSVTLFATLDGVELAIEANDLESVDCRTPRGIETLSVVLDDFMDSGGVILTCPLCMGEREHTADDLIDDEDVNNADAFDIHALFLYADKVLSF